MQDMLVNLYATDAPFLRPNPALQSARAEPVTIRRALAPERNLVIDWVAAHFSQGWADEAAVAFASTPTKCLLAQTDNQGAGNRLLGFACFDATALGFFGPLAVDAAERGSGIGAALLKATLSAMREYGYAYAIIGGVGPAEFYTRVAGAALIPDSTPGVYAGLLRPNPSQKDSVK
jgi:GNAT superfamily N-acetyltransferase